MSKVKHPELLTHVQNKQVAPSAHPPRSQYQVRRLGDSHEEPLHVGMSNRDRPSTFNLGLQRRNDGSSAPENVAEPNHDIGTVSAASGADHKTFGKALGRA